MSLLFCTNEMTQFDSDTVEVIAHVHYDREYVKYTFIVCNIDLDKKNMISAWQVISLVHDWFVDFGTMISVATIINKYIDLKFRNTQGIFFKFILNNQNTSWNTWMLTNILQTSIYIYNSHNMIGKWHIIIFLHCYTIDVIVDCNQECVNKDINLLSLLQWCLGRSFVAYCILIVLFLFVCFRTLFAWWIFCSAAICGAWEFTVFSKKVLW